MKSFQWRQLKKFWSLLNITAPDPSQMLWRIQAMERDIVLPLKAAAVCMLVYFLFVRSWVDITGTALDNVVKYLRFSFWIYVPLNLLGAAVLFKVRQLPLALVQWSVFTLSLVDALFLGAVTTLTNGYDSILFWAFLGLIIRNAASVPKATSQLALNVSVSLCFVLAGFLEASVRESVNRVAENLDLDPASRITLNLDTGNPAEPLVLRLTLLWVVAFCAYGVQVLLERQRLALAEARESALREAQLRSTSRLAAEIAHQIKNPLAIINNAVFSLRRALASKKNDVEPQAQIIQEEVERADRIITQLMGYARLSEGRVEKIDVIEELERAVRQVFPSGAEFEIKFQREYAAKLPPLFMHRGHLNEVFVNILQNAREVVRGRGTVALCARHHGDYAVEVSIADDGPGIPADKTEKVFEAYYTSKEKGTGLGLAIVRHNVELYGGNVRIESELGKGARFVLLFPAKLGIKPANER